MAVELVTGHAGTPHVSGEDVGALVAGLVGTGAYVLGSAPVPQMTTANLLSVPACDIVMQGRHVRLTGTNTVSIDNGSQVGKRSDIIYVEYSLDDGTGVELVSDLAVAKGTTGSAAVDPPLPHSGSILDAGNPVDVAICRVTLDALTPTATWLLPVLPTLASMTEQHVVLWSGKRSQSVSSGITLSQPASDFDALVFEYEGEVGMRSSAYVSDPDGKVVALSTSFRNLWGDSGDAYITDVKAVEISGRKIDTKEIKGRGYMSGRIGVNTGTGDTWVETKTGGVDFIGIVRVTGVRYAKGRA